MANTSECSVCYGETGPFQKLCCGHVFCKGCIKNWYLRGAAGSSCPMCRRPIYFKGFHKVRDEWSDEAWESKCAEVFSEAIDAAFEDAQGMVEVFPPKWSARIMNDLIEDLKDTEKTYRYLKSEDVTSEDIEYVLLGSVDYYSDRHINKYKYHNDPPKTFETKYPWLAQQRSGAMKRVRARTDPWVTLSFYVVI